MTAGTTEISKQNNKEDMDKYTKELNEKTERCAKLLSEGKIEKADEIKAKIDSIYMKFRNEQVEKKMYNESTNFGIANHIFDQKMPELFKKNRKAMKEFVQTVRSDKNLVAEAMFYKAMRDYDGSVESDKYVNECLDLATRRIDFNTVNESNRKIADVMKKYGIMSDGLISEERKQMYECCDYLLTNKKKLSNVVQMNERTKMVKNFLNENKNQKHDEKQPDVDRQLSEFEQKYGNTLSEYEHSIVRDITNESTSNGRKRELFNMFKEETLDKINAVMTESDNDEKEKLRIVKEEIENINFNANTLKKDIVKLIEVKEIMDFD